MSDAYIGWYVLYVKSQHEKKIDFILGEKQLDSFLPLVTTVRQWSDRKKKVQLPLFPSYIFLRVKSRTEFSIALNVNGVYNFLRFGDYYAKVKDVEIDSIKLILRVKGISDINISSSQPKIGDKMRINYGPFYGLDCEVVKINNTNKLIVRIDSLKQNITATICPRFLAPSPTRKSKNNNIII